MDEEKKVGENNANKKPEDPKTSDKSGRSENYKPANGNSGKQGREGKAGKPYGRRGHGRENDKKKVNNDVAWYGSDSGLLQAAAQLSFTTALGAPSTPQSLQPTDSRFAVDENSADLSQTTPGIMALRIFPTYGVAAGPNDPMNVASRALFTKLRWTLSSNLTGIEAPDVMVYHQCMDSIFSYYAYMLRLYGTIARFSALNRYQASALVTAMGGDYDDLRVNLGNLRFYLRYFASKVNKGLKLPKSAGVLKRHFWIYSNVFKDAPVEKSQMYVHVPGAFYRWSSTQYDTGSAAIAVEFSYTVPGATRMKYSDLVTFGDSLLNPLLQDEDVSNISGIILRAFGDDGCFELPEVSDDYTVEPTYSEEILGQIHNADVLGFDMLTHKKPGSSGGNLDIRQKAGASAQDNYLVWSPLFTVDSHTNDFGRAVGNFVPRLMDSFVDNPKPEEIMINSRNKLVTTATTSLASGLKESDPYYLKSDITITSCGFDIIEEAYVYVYTAVGQLRHFLMGSGYVAPQVYEGLSSSTDAYYGEDVAAMILLFGLVSKFDWAPRFVLGRLFGSDGSTAKCYLISDSWDYNNTAVAPASFLTNLHTVAIMGGLNIGLKVDAYRGAHAEK